MALIDQSTGIANASGKIRKADLQWVPDLLRWFDQNKRSMPWREHPTPYYRWLSEIMLQQTRVDTVIPYFNRFVERYPDILSLGKAEEDDVLKLWEGLGYYSRARNLLKAARLMVKQHSGTFPATEKEALALPGIGPYSAAAVLSMAYGVPLPSVDGNVLRVYCRLTAFAANVLEAATVKKVQQSLKEIMPMESPGDFNESMMELGAVICLPANPRCGECPIQKNCVAYQNGQVEDLPIRIKKDKTTRHYYLLYYLLNETGTEVLVRKNPPKGLLGGLWAFPMIELSEQEMMLGSETNSMDHAASRSNQKWPESVSDRRSLECIAAEKAAHEWAASFSTIVHRGRLKHIFSHRHWTMEIMAAKSVALTPPGYGWIPLEQLSQLAFPEVYQKVIRLMEDRPAVI
jgi:A/G-specific adenine glycosylase